MSIYRNLISEMYIQGFEASDDEPTFRVPENFDRYNRGSGWQAYRGGNDWENGSTGVAVYLNPEGYNKEMARIWFEIAFPKDLEEAINSTTWHKDPRAIAAKKWGDKAARKWVIETAKLHKASRHQIVPGGSFCHKRWGECFIKALQTDAMKPYVKKYGVDRTKWIGMKRCTLNEAVTDDKSWWMDPDGKLIPVAEYGHVDWAKNFLQKQHNVDTNQYESEEDIYDELYTLGWVRVSVSNMLGHPRIDIHHSQVRRMTAEQWRILKDLGMEIGAQEIQDHTVGKQTIVRLYEEKMIYENFIENKEWFVYEGTNTITAVFDDNSRQSFKIHFRNNRGEDRNKHRTKAARTWKKLAMEIRKNAGLNEAGNPIVIPWTECFSRALENLEMREYIDDLRAMPIFEMYFPFRKKLNEMSFKDLVNSMKRYAIRKGGYGKTQTVGDNGRIQKSKQMRSQSLRVISTIGKDGQEHETSLFKYKSGPSHITKTNEHPGGKPHHGYIMFLENSDKGQNADIEVNCDCEDYQYVWAKPNADNGAGRTSQDGGIDTYSGFHGGANANNGGEPRIRNPHNVPGLCKHLLHLSKFLLSHAAVAPAKTDKDQEEPDAVAPTKKLSKLKHRGKPINIFESMRRFALSNPTFDVPYED